MNQEIAINAVDKLSNTMRIYGETRIHSIKLFDIDVEEAVNNIDRGFDSMLESFHGVYEFVQQNKLLNCFNYGDTSAIILLRNARHHVTDSLFKSWNAEMIRDGRLRKMEGASFLLAGYIPISEDSMIAEYYLKISDFFERLNHKSVKNREEEKILFENELSFIDILNKADAERYPLDQVYINVIPIFMSAVSRLFSTLKDNCINFKGYDSEVFVEHFTIGPLNDLTQPMYKSINAPIS